MRSVERVNSSDRQGVGLCVEDPLLQVNKIVVTEEKVEILQGFCQEEGLLYIILVGGRLKERRVTPDWLCWIGGECYE